MYSEYKQAGLLLNKGIPGEREGIENYETFHI
jgi:hypothetical protein